MQTYQSQKGVGLMEVLVSLLILALAILGFVAVQLRAMDTASEASNRIQAMNLARDLSEKIRINNSREAFNTYQSSTQTEKAPSSEENCFEKFCTPKQKAIFDVNQFYAEVQNLGMTTRMITCPGIKNNRQCIYVAWGKTTPTHETGDRSCTRGSNNSFSYDKRATCIVVETYS